MLLVANENLQTENVKMPDSTRLRQAQDRSQHP